MPPIPSARLILTDLVLQLKASNENLPGRSNGSVSNPLKARQEDVREVIIALEYLVPGGVMAALDVLDKGLVTRYSLRAEGKKEQNVEEDSEEKVRERGEGNIRGEVDTVAGSRESTTDQEVSGTPTDLSGKMDENSEAPATEREIPGTPNGSDTEISDVSEEWGGPAPTRKNEEPTPSGEESKKDEKYSYYVRSEQPARSRWSKKPPRPTPTYSVRPTAWFCTCPAFLFAAFATAPKEVATSRYPNATEKNRKSRKKWEAEEFSKVWDMMETHGWVWGGRMLGVHAPPVCKHLLACVLAENCGDLFMPFVNRAELDLEEMVGMSANIRRV